MDIKIENWYNHNYKRIVYKQMVQPDDDCTCRLQKENQQQNRKQREKVKEKKQEWKESQLGQ